MYGFPSTVVNAYRRRAIALGIVVLALVACIDWITGPNVSVLVFYIPSLCLLTWFLGKPAGFLVALVYTAIWLAIDAGVLGRWGAPLLYWNAAVRCATLVVMTYLVDVCKNLAAQVERHIEWRTEALREEVRIRRAAEEAIHRLSSQLEAAEDEQRRRIAHEIHDTLGQQLSLTKLQLQTFADSLPEPAAGAQALRPTIELLDRLIRETRTLMFELHPAMLQDLGLAATLQQYCRQLAAQTGAALSSRETGAPLALPVEMSSFLFRAAKELISNALRHGQAREIIVALRWSPGSVRLVVDDDGRGFDPQQPTTASGRQRLGLAWIRERTQSLGGTMQLETAASAGAVAAGAAGTSPDLEGGGGVAGGVAGGAGTRVILDFPVAAAPGVATGARP
jgi:signal transduction histidine kinase